MFETCKNCVQFYRNDMGTPLCHEYNETPHPEKRNCTPSLINSKTNKSKMEKVLYIRYKRWVFKESGKYYTDDTVELPDVFPADMELHKPHIWEEIGYKSHFRVFLPDTSDTQYANSVHAIPFMLHPNQVP